MKKFLSLLLLGTMLLSSTLNVSAESFTVSDETLVNDNLEIQLTLEKDVSYAVALPKGIELEDSTDYEIKVGVYLDASEEHTLVVEPEDGTFTLSNIVAEGSTAKEDITATVVNVKSEWCYDDADLCNNVTDIMSEDKLVTMCKVLGMEIPTGEWSGLLPIRIALLEDKSFSVDIIDSTNSTDLNGIAIAIVGDTKRTLLNELVDSGLIDNARDINAVIDVNCDAFDDKATATFNVSHMAEPGDRIVIYHYDEENSEWEYIDTVIVDSDGKINCEFSSFSPVCFMNIGAVEEGHICNYEETTLREATCTTDGVIKYTCVCGDVYTESVKVGHTLDGSNYNCIICGESVAGIYDTNRNLLCTWEEFGVDIEEDYSKNSVDSPGYKLKQMYSNAVVLNMPDGISRIGDYAFYDCNILDSVYSGYALESIGIQAFYGCGLRIWTLPASLVTIGERAFENCKSLYNVWMWSAQEIGPYAFYNCTSLKDITLPENLVTIKSYAFGNCTALESIVFPINLKSIDPYAFSGCTKLTYVRFDNSSGWYVGTSSGSKSTALNSSDLWGSTGANYLKSTYLTKYWTRY